MTKLFVAPPEGASPHQAATNEEYGRLCIAALQSRNWDAGRERMGALQDQVLFPIILVNKDGKEVMSIGSREGQIEREMSKIICRCLDGTDTPEDRKRMDDLLEELASRMLNASLCHRERETAVAVGRREARTPQTPPKRTSKFGLGFLGL